jgi:hypothetical protein
MSKPLSERELLEIQIKTYEFYAGLIDRAVGGSAAAKLPKWDEQRSIEYKQLAEQLRAQLAALDEQEQGAPASSPSESEGSRSPTDAPPAVASPEAG